MALHSSLHIENLRQINFLTGCLFAYTSAFNSDQDYRKLVKASMVVSISRNIVYTSGPSYLHEFFMYCIMQSFEQSLITFAFLYILIPSLIKALSYLACFCKLQLYNFDNPFAPGFVFLGSINNLVILSFLL